ncbi:dimethylhistidine N-methyltransferase [Parasphingorhabdus marina DSM 22363]|uniref:Dimethylhistidine N-methyltransferase n=1 Tax=Parasphingorhabdus marina DSM 22363 TaxID=1123272 RepID=A0A1N6CXT8_9SPHN|nr:L-histidine N(alpha)-methyltransferase [Parasphingorhabdus marina]SIN63398.1 dimethylhistidine N-methyltransferase [Parasphingorhabdus marina DSM 22363]
MDMIKTAVDSGFRNDVISCFAGERFAIPARWLYDRRGSELFEQITELPEYYPTRTETALLANFSGDVGAHIGHGRAVVEFGSGSSTKTPHLLRAVAPSAYVPIDISGEFLSASSDDLQERFPELPIHPLEADFMHPLQLPDDVAGLPKLGFFPGSTIGNMVARTSVDLLRSMRETLGQSAYLLIGFDRIKDEDMLVAAYDDSAGVTAEFSLNLLHRINRELNADIPVGDFAHVAVWNDLYARIEIFLEARSDVSFAVEGHDVRMQAGERIHIENSHKYGLRDARLMLRAAGWSPVRDWSDENDYFSLILAEARPFKHAP